METFNWEFELSLEVEIVSSMILKKKKKTTTTFQTLEMRSLQF